MGGTIGSFKFACYSAIKKLKDNNCYVDGESAADDGGVEVAEKPTGRKSSSKKRKAEGAVEDGGDKVTKKGRAAKKVAVKAEDVADSV